MKRHPGLDPEVVERADATLTGLPRDAPVGDVGIGVVAPHDFALDRELWRWVPERATLLVTRTPYCALPVSVDQAAEVGDVDVVAECTSRLLATRPEVVAYACTSGSFVHGVEGERALLEAMFASGAPAAVSTSGAMVSALRHLGVSRIAVATPYDEAITCALEGYLADAGVAVTGSARLGLAGLIWRVPYAVTVELAREAVAAGSGCEAVFLSCTNLPTYDLIAPLERELGIPVLTANQVTVWAALQLAGLDAVGPGQRLIDTRHGRAA
ncbi:maleate cis-trans isomerase family protein [Luteipulveratus flavus]|uniref:Aspartate/glutamate racemase family protein n=1 Tax=Luteipulveratus flavus TaxID=3031728 RepID=A0ABT6C462_9MICO|nr:aspartate/glutamate racemase family protein [Luteipulveratus sp. YIM 133296]MDF8263729.1 aspartate/glutamate racemase family protein [Luteipulveratus sp. YIM 133296]